MARRHSRGKRTLIKQRGTVAAFIAALMAGEMQAGTTYAVKVSTPEIEKGELVSREWFGTLVVRENGKTEILERQGKLPSAETLLRMVRARQANRAEGRFWATEPYVEIVDTKTPSGEIIRREILYENWWKISGIPVELSRHSQRGDSMTAIVMRLCTAPVE